MNEICYRLNRIKKRKSIWYTLMIVILGILLVRYPAEYATHDGSYTIVITSENQMDSARATFT
ncbi:MAG: hypothetical protein JRN15_06335, partial [Nitrososphaerota archaeon]|nr:hypothetical protein [Nitrososphaerota archaeon]